MCGSVGLSITATAIYHSLTAQKAFKSAIWTAISKELTKVLLISVMAFAMAKIVSRVWNHLFYPPIPPKKVDNIKDYICPIKQDIESTIDEVESDLCSENHFDQGFFNLVRKMFTQLHNGTSSDSGGLYSRYELVQTKNYRDLVKLFEENEVMRTYTKAIMEKLDPSQVDFLLYQTYSNDIQYDHYIFFREKPHTWNYFLLSYGQSFPMVILHAILRGDENKVKDCINYIHPNFTYRNETPFLTALSENKSSLLPILVEKGATVPKKHDGESITKEARSLEALKFLENQGIDLTISLGKRNPAAFFLERSTTLEEVKMVEYLLSKFTIETIGTITMSNGKSFVSDLYFEWVLSLEKNPELSAGYQKLFDSLTKNTQSIDPAILSDLLLRYRKGKTSFKSYLIQFGIPEKTLELAQENKDIFSLITKIEGITSALQKELVRHHLDPEEISLQVVHEAHLLKKEVKKHLTTYSQGLQDTYDRFVKVYNQTVDFHPILSQIRLISKDLRQAAMEGVKILSKTSGKRLVKFYALWAPTTPEGLSDISKLCLKTFRLYFSDMRKRILKSGMEAILFNGRPILKGFHGTGSPAFLGMLQDKAIKASGTQFKDGSASLWGEGTGAIIGINITGISAVEFDSSWEEHFPNIVVRSPPTRFLISEGYASRKVNFTSYGTRSLGFTLTDEWGLLKSLSASLNIEKMEGYKKKDLFDIERAVLRLRTVDPQFQEKVKEIRSALQDGMESSINQPFKLEFKNIIGWIDSDPPYKLNPDNPLLKNPIPLVLATDNVQGRRSKDEIIFEKSLKFDQHIQYAFTSEEHVPTVRENLKNEKFEKMEGYSFDVAHYLEMRRMIHGSTKWIEITDDSLPQLIKVFHSLNQQQGQDLSKELTKAFTVAKESFDPKKAFIETFEKTLKYNVEAVNNLKDAINTVEDHLNLARDFHSFVLPHYVRPFERTPSYTDDTGKKHVVKESYFGRKFTNYDDYINQVENGDIPPKDPHGPMHATSVLLFGLVLRMLYISLGRKDLSSIYHLGIGASVHDGKRQTDSTKDYWDKESAELYLDLMFMLNRKPLERITKAISDKDPQDGKGFETDDQRVIHDSDCLELNRIPTIRSGQRQFEPKDNLCFYDFKELDETDKKNLIDEVKKFVEIKDQNVLKAYLDKHSDNYLADLVKIFKYAHQKTNAFPLMAKLLKHTLMILAPDNDKAPLDPKIINILCLN